MQSIFFRPMFSEAKRFTTAGVETHVWPGLAALVSHGSRRQGYCKGRVALLVLTWTSRA